jgi:ammonia channel protein AmtB
MTFTAQEARYSVRMLAIFGVVAPLLLFVLMLEVDEAIGAAELHGSVGVLGIPVLALFALATPVLLVFALHRSRDLTTVDVLVSAVPALMWGGVVLWFFVLPFLRA